MKQLKIFIIKEFLHVFRDSKTMLLLFGLPVAQIVLFGFALTNEMKNARIVVCDLARDISSGQLTEKIGQSGNFDIQEVFSDLSRIERSFEEGNVKLAIVFPGQFHHTLHHDGKSQIQIIADASDPNTAATLTSYVTSIIRDFQQEIQSAGRRPVTIMPEVRMLYNPELKGATNFVPGVMALVLLLVCVLMTSVSIVREKELGTMEILLVSPLNPAVVLIAKAIPYFLLSMVNLTVILLLAVTLLGMPFNGSFLLLYGISALFILCALALGLLISNSTNSQQVAMLVSLMGMMLPTVMFTGFMFPLDSMPDPLQWFAHIVPSKWYYDMIKSIMIKGLGIGAIWKEAAILTGITLLLFLVSMRKFKIRLA